MYQVVVVFKRKGAATIQCRSRREFQEGRKGTFKSPAAPVTNFKS